MSTFRAVAFSVLVCLFAAAPAQTAFRGKNGRLVIERLAPGFPGFFYGPGFAELDPGGRTRELPRTLRDADAVRFSPDGRRALAVRDDKLDVLDLTTCVQTRLSSSIAMGRGARHASWSPDGRRVVFSGRADGGLRLFVIDRTGVNVAPLTSPPHGSWDVMPVWSPAGGSIAFVRRSADIHTQLPRLMTVDLRTRRTRTLREYGDDAFQIESVDWSPRARRLVYAVRWEVRAAASTTRRTDVYTIAANGTRERLVRRWASNPVWSPSGARLAYTLLMPRPDSSPSTKLVTSSPDGSGVRALPTRLPSFAVEWRPRTTPVRRVCQVLRNT